MNAKPAARGLREGPALPVCLKQLKFLLGKRQFQNSGSGRPDISFAERRLRRALAQDGPPPNRRAVRSTSERGRGPYTETFSAARKAEMPFLGLGKGLHAWHRSGPGCAQRVAEAL
jgi:hypothetical protein